MARLLPLLLVLVGFPHFSLAQTASELVSALERALEQKQLLEPAGSSAWEIHARLQRSNLPEAEKNAARQALVAALSEAGKETLRAYLQPRDPRPTGPTDLLEGNLTAEEFDRAALFFERAAELEPQQGVWRSRYQFCRGRALLAKGLWREARPLLRQSIALDPTVPYGYNGLGITYLMEHRPGDSVPYFQMAIQRTPQWVYVRHNLALAYFALREYESAEREWVVATVYAPSLAFLYVNLGVLYLQVGRALEAQRELQHAQELDPDGPVTNHNLAVLLEMGRRPKEAEKHYRKALRADPRQVAPRLNLARLYRRSGRKSKAKKELRAALAVDPRNSAVREELGTLLLEEGREAEAESELLAAVSTDPAPPRALEALGDLYAGRRNFTEALDHYRQALVRTTDPRARQQLQLKISALGAPR